MWTALPGSWNFRLCLGLGEEGRGKGRAALGLGFVRCGRVWDWEMGEMGWVSDMLVGFSADGWMGGKCDF